MERLSKRALDDVTYHIIGAAFEVHRETGPGLLENVYHRCMKQELSSRGLAYISEMAVRLDYKGLSFDADLRCDLLVEGCIAVELKAVDRLAPVHEAQLLTYMKLLRVPKGILINFTCANIFREGQRTFVNELFRSLPDE